MAFAYTSVGLDFEGDLLDDQHHVCLQGVNTVRFAVVVFGVFGWSLAFYSVSRGMVFQTRSVFLRVNVLELKQLLFQTLAVY